MSQRNEAQRNKDLVRRVIDEIWTGRRLELVDALYAEDFRCHVEPGEDWVGRGDVRLWVTRMHELLEGFEERVEDLVAEGDRVAVRTRLSGVWRGVAEDGRALTRPVTSPGLLLYRIADGRIAEQWEVANAAGIARQMGAPDGPSGS